MPSRLVHSLTIICQTPQPEASRYLRQQGSACSDLFRLKRQEYHVQERLS